MLDIDVIECESCVCATVRSVYNFELARACKTSHPARRMQAAAAAQPCELFSQQRAVAEVGKLRDAAVGVRHAQAGQKLLQLAAQPLRLRLQAGWGGIGD